MPIVTFRGVKVASNGRVIVALAFTAMLAACGNRDVARFYILTHENSSERLLGDVAELLSEQKLKSESGSATDDKGNTLRVLEAYGQQTKVWVQNVPLSGQEDPVLCGDSGDPRPDAGQFVATFEPWLPFFDKDAPLPIAASTKNRLIELGYDVRDRPEVCSEHAK